MPPPLPPTLSALSVRQPWAGLIIAGVKRIEVRSWLTTHRGPLLIHAAKIRDERPEVERWVTPALRPICAISGGVIGLVELIDCLEYRRAAEFEADQLLHRNAPAWFRPGATFGFRLARPVAIPFHSCPGQTRFFNVTGVELPPIIFPPEMAP
ncbi:ASCH domain-containing protein [Limnoglobus roseus]|uniref:ASCH domain-containing protein n=1 Tax=Limnoglobus roseus TaxID=2598579 RepID=A0A5C1A3G2_9BACT|nr:ASCH domain-containing protein [Limnoglobus roseus]QEL13621.1 ASCH domain-containing protein [Limnoglobus roseus]